MSDVINEISISIYYVVYHVILIYYPVRLVFICITEMCTDAAGGSCLRDVRRIGGGCGLCGGAQEKEWMGCFLDDLRAFGINADQWTTAARDERE